MKISGWYSGCLVQSFPLVDRESIYFNVSYYAPGQSLSQPPVWEKTAYVTDNEAGRRMVHDFTDSLTNYISTLKIPSGGHAILTF